MKIIIAGAGKVGATLTRQLSAEGYDLTLIDSKARVLDASIERYDVIGVPGNCAAIEILEEAGVRQADLLIAATSADEVNLLCCMTAHGLNPKLHTIARIRNPDYVGQAYTMRSMFGLSMAFNPERQAAIEIERLLKFPGFLKRDSFGKGRAEIVELKVDRDSMLCDRPLSSLYQTVRCKILVCAVLRSGTAITPDGNFVLRADDRIFLTASAQDLSILLKNLGIIPHKAHRVMIAGGSRTSYYLANELSKGDTDVTIIEVDRARCVELAALLPNVCVVHGDASDQAFLEEEGLSSCDALITLTGLDEMNLVMSLYAHSCGVPQVITKLGRIEHIRLLDTLPLGSVICPKELCCNNIVRYVRAMRNQVGAAVAVHAIADGHAEAIEFLVDDATLHCGEPLKKLQLQKNVLVVCIINQQKTEIASGDSRFHVGDTLIVVSSGGVILHQLNDIFE